MQILLTYFDTSVKTKLLAQLLFLDRESDRVLDMWNPSRCLAKRWLGHLTVRIEEIIQAIGTATGAATQLRQAFEVLLSGEVTTGRINALLTDLESLLSIIEAINS